MRESKKRKEIEGETRRGERGRGGWETGKGGESE